MKSPTAQNKSNQIPEIIVEATALSTEIWQVLICFLNISPNLYTVLTTMYSTTYNIGSKLRTQTTSSKCCGTPKKTHQIPLTQRSLKSLEFLL